MTQPEQRLLNTAGCDRADRWDWDWRPFPTDTIQESAIQESMISAAKRFIADVYDAKEPRWLVLVGHPGCGKTHIADRIRWFLRDYGEAMYNRDVRAVIDPDNARVETIYSYAQEGAVMVKWGTLIERLREGETSLFAKACEDHYKVIDDLGVNSLDKEGNATPFACQKMGELLDRRIRKWTIVTTNWSIDEISMAFDSRVASRLMRNSEVIKCFGLRDYLVRMKVATKAA